MIAVRLARMRVAMMKIRTMGVSVCHSDMHVPVLVPGAGRFGCGSVDMIVMAIVMAMPMGVLLCLVAMLVFV